MRLPTLTDLARGSATLEWYSEGVLRYDIEWIVEQGFIPIIGHFKVDIPIEDAGGGHFTPYMRGINLLRWARKQLDLAKEAHADQTL